MLHDATIHKGVVAGFNLGARRGDDARDARRDLFDKLGMSLFHMGRDHHCEGCYEKKPANILGDHYYMLPCKDTSVFPSPCSGNGTMDLRNMDFGIPNDDPQYDEKIMGRFQEYIICGQCEVCQLDVHLACVAAAQAQAAQDEIEDGSVDGSEEDL